MLGFSFPFWRFAYSKNAAYSDGRLDNDGSVILATEFNVSTSARTQKCWGSGKRQKAEFSRDVLANFKRDRAKYRYFSPEPFLIRFVTSHTYNFDSLS